MAKPRLGEKHAAHTREHMDLANSKLFLLLVISLSTTITQILGWAQGDKQLVMPVWCHKKHTEEQQPNLKTDKKKIR